MRKRMRKRDTRYVQLEQNDYHQNAPIFGNRFRFFTTTAQ